MTQASKMIRVEIDHAANASYIQLSDKPISRTRCFNDRVIVDLDDEGVVVGIEVLGLDTPLPLTDLEHCFHIHSSVVNAIQALRPTVGYAWKVATAVDPAITAHQPVSVCQ